MSIFIPLFAVTRAQSGFHVSVVAVDLLGEIK